MVLSGIFNFLGVLGARRAYAIVHLLPVELLINVDTGRGLAMVFAMLAAAIAWNLGTWYFGIPASSSHTLIGSILGVGLANALITDLPLGERQLGQGHRYRPVAGGLPVAGFLIAGGCVLALKRWLPLSKMHKTPEQRRELDNKKHPPFWNRLVLVLSAMGVSLCTARTMAERHRPDHAGADRHRANFVLDTNSTTYQIERTRDAATHLSAFYHRNEATLGDYLALAAAAHRTCRPASAAIPN